MSATGLYTVDKKTELPKCPPIQEWLNCGISAQYSTGGNYVRDIHKQNRRLS